MIENKKIQIAIKVKLKNDALQRFIEKKGWTQADFARAINYNNQATVGDWFNLKDYPRNKDMLFKISELLQDHPDNIFPEFCKDKDFLSVS